MTNTQITTITPRCRVCDIPLPPTSVGDLCAGCAEAGHRALIFRLTKRLHFEAPKSWSVQARYAFLRSEGKPFDVEAGRMVIYLGSQPACDGCYLYRLSDGRMGVLDTAPDGRFEAVRDPEIVALAGQVKALPELAAERGLHVETVSALNPFALIVCPLCRGTEFTTLDLASVWCDRCNTRFSTRQTAGDPGVVVDADPESYSPAHARYIIPRRDMALSVVLKDFGYSGHPSGQCSDWCVNGSTRQERIEHHNYYVDDPTSLRDPAHWCGLEVYDWGLSGRAQDPERSERRLRAVDGDPEAADRIYGKLVTSRRLPPVDLLAEGEEDGQGREWWYLADMQPDERGISMWPLWWKVQAGLEPAPYGDGQVVQAWTVVDRSLCPSCLRPASEGDHKYCDWDEMKWQPPKDELEAE